MATSVSNNSTQSAQRSRRPGSQDRDGHSGWPAFTRWCRRGAALQYPLCHPNGKQLHHADNQQRVAQGEGVRYSVCQENEQTAAGEAANVEPKLLVEDVGELVPLLDGGDSVNDLHLNREIGDVMQRSAEEQTHHEEENPGGVEEQRVGQIGRASCREPDGENDD